MKKCLILFVAVALVTAVWPAIADDQAASGQTPSWWHIPYPDRFDTALLNNDQSLISVKGNRFFDSQGVEFQFRGVSIADPYKLDFQGHWNQALFEELQRWGVNSVRLPIHPLAWRNKGAKWYFDRIDEAVVWANALDMYLVIDWHSIGNLEAEMFQHPMYVTSRVETFNFWKGIAHRYLNVPTIAVYELFNEPTDNFVGAGAGSLGKAPWANWRDIQEDLIDLVYIYDKSAIPLIAGFNWAYDLSEIADNPIRREGIAYAIHPYPQKVKPDKNTQTSYFELWQQQWGYVADNYPMIATELGWAKEDEYGAHVPVINNDGSYGPNIVTFMEDRHISWMVWNFDPEWGPTMIKDWDFTPTSQGRFFKEVMLNARDGQLLEATLPSPRVAEYSWMSMERWWDMHNEDMAIADEGKVELLFLGDSITEGWPANIWDRDFSDYQPANFGIGGDRTENVLWRLRNGDAGNLDPKAIVLMIGVNNFGFGGDSPADVTAGVQAIIDELHKRFKKADVILLGILPYGELAGTQDRSQVKATNALLQKLADDPQVSFYDIGEAFLQEDGSIATDVMADYLHPTEQGYEIFTAQIKPILASHLK